MESREQRIQRYKAAIEDLQTKLSELEKDMVFLDSTGDIFTLTDDGVRCDQSFVEGEILICHNDLKAFWQWLSRHLNKKDLD